MTDEKVEKVARAIAYAAYRHSLKYDEVTARALEEKEWPDFVPQARAALEAAEAGVVPRAAVWRVVKDFHGQVSTYTVGSLVFVTSTYNGKATIEPVKGLGCVVGVPLDRLEYTGLYASPPASREEREWPAYMMTVEPQEDGTWLATCPDLPGCIATADTPDAALGRLRDVQASWLAVCRERGIKVPEPATAIRARGG